MKFLRILSLLCIPIILIGVAYAADLLVRQPSSIISVRPKSSPKIFLTFRLDGKTSEVPAELNGRPCTPDGATIVAMFHIINRGLYWDRQYMGWRCSAAAGGRSGAAPDDFNDRLAAMRQQMKR